ncbi:MAG: hypothetical protein K8T90_11225 [Planctomycetes bacterium]|nr:hypothetical protein [Planctomycetota bacterium]
MNYADAVATVGWVLLVIGWWFRRNRRLHLGFVLPGMVVDLGLVIFLELTRSVIERTAGMDHSMTNAALPNLRTYGTVESIHIATSTLAVVLYIPTIWLGSKLAWGTAGPGVRAWHKRCAIGALALRTIGFAFMWGV